MANRNTPSDPNRNPPQPSGQPPQGDRHQSGRTTERGRMGQDSAVGPDRDPLRDDDEDLGERQAEGNLGNERTRTKK